MSRFKVKKGMQVKVLTGVDKGVTGEVLSVDAAGSRVLVRGVNVRKKHRRSNGQAGQAGIESFECFIHSSNVAAI